VFNFSGSEIVFLLLLALIVLGPEKLPEAVRRFGKTYGEFKKMTTGFQTELKSALDEPMREMRETADLFKKAASFDFDDSDPESQPQPAAELKPASAPATPVVAQEPTPAPPATASAATFSAAPPLREPAPAAEPPVQLPNELPAEPVESAEPVKPVEPPATGVDTVVVRDAPVTQHAPRSASTRTKAEGSIVPSENSAAAYQRPVEEAVEPAPVDPVPVDPVPVEPVPVDPVKVDPVDGAPTA
jgi:sec-independent protein translocase protein TatB